MLVTFFMICVYDLCLGNYANKTRNLYPDFNFESVREQSFHDWIVA